MATRTLLRDFQLANIGLIGCTLTVYTVDAAGAKTSTRATLYDSLTGSGTLQNPQDLDSEGKVERPIYHDVPVVCEVTGAHVATVNTGAIFPGGSYRGDWVTATLYLPGDFVTDGANGDSTNDFYRVANYHTSGTWATDKADTAKLVRVIDMSDLTDQVVPDWSLTTKGKSEAATTAEIDAEDNARGMRPDQFAGSKFNPNGKHMIPIMAGGMQSATTNGAAAGAVETTTNKVIYRTLDFDTTTQEFAGFSLPMPKSWNEGTVTFRALWTAASGSGGVAWALQGLACSDDDAIDQAYGTEQVVTDTLITAGDVHRTSESSAITIAGSPAASDLVFFRVKRVPSNGSDTLGVDARLIGVELYLTTDTGTDA